MISSQDQQPDAQAQADERQRHQRTRDRLIFQRDLNEVHLLLDFLSGRADKSLADLTMADPLPPHGQLTAAEIVQRITSFRYPPPNDEVIKAENASFLLLAKDRLSRLASPARGTSIAYTAMFAETSRSFSDMIRGWFGRASADRSLSQSLSDSQLTLAVETFPGLRKHAVYFRRLFSPLPYIALIWLLLTLLTYWQVALGQSVLQRLQQFYKERATLIQDNPSVLAQDICPAYVAGQDEFPGISDKPEAIKVASACRHLWSIDKSRFEARLDLAQVVHCDSVGHDFVSWLLGWQRVLCDYQKSPRVAGSASIEEARIGWQPITSVIGVMSTYVLPMMFAILGTLIALMRNVHNKVRDSELAPRDRMLLLLGVPMGAIAGVAIGLFFSPSASPISLDAGSPAGNLTLTASGLGFLAGYGAEAVFRFLDSLLRLVLPERPVTETTQQRPASQPSTSAAVPAAPAVPPQSAPAV